MAVYQPLASKEKSSEYQGMLKSKQDKVGWLYDYIYSDKYVLDIIHINWHQDSCARNHLRIHIGF